MSSIANIPENRTLRGAVIDYTSDRTLPLNECKVYFSPVQAGEGTSSPENVREISGWDSVTLNVNSRLPSEYQEVEYIESSEGAYLKKVVSVLSGETFKAEVKFQYLGNITNNFWLAGDGTQRNAFQFEFGYYGGWYNNDNNNGKYNIISGSHPNQIIEAYI